jgi:hypothetical protein
MLERPYTASFAHSPSPALSPEHPDYDKILHRANQIQRQKEVELQVLAATEILLDADSSLQTLSASDMLLLA